MQTNRLTDEMEYDVTSDIHKSKRIADTCKKAYSQLGVGLDIYLKSTRMDIYNKIVGNKNTVKPYWFNSRMEDTDKDLLFYKTPLWLVTGKNRRLVADQIVRDIIREDVMGSLNFNHLDSYGKYKWVELYRDDFGKTLDTLNHKWLMYLSDASTYNMDSKKSTMITNIIMSRTEDAKYNKCGRPTVITIKDGSDFMDGSINNLVFSDVVKVITT